MIEHLEVLESRRLLTNLVAVSVSGGAVSLTDTSARKVSSGDDFTVAYTGTQVVLTGHNGTMFQVGSQTLSTFTATVTAPISIKMSLNARGNTVSVTGDGTTDLSSFVVDLGRGRRQSSNSLSLTKVVADSMTIDGGRRNDSVVLTQCTVNKNLDANLGRGKRSGDSLDLETTTVKGNMTDKTSKLVMNHSTVTGTFTDKQPGKNSSFQSTDTTYTGAADVTMGRNGVINMNASADGPNHFMSSLNVTGRRREPTTITASTGALVNDVTPTLKNAVLNGSSKTAATVAAPTVNSQSNASATPTITGTFDSVNTPNLSVAVNSKTYKLGTDSVLTSPTTGTWSLNLANAPLATGTQKFGDKVTVTSSNNSGVTKTGTGVVANDAIKAYLALNGLTGTTTSDGLTYVIKTLGTGATPTTGHQVTVNYTGHVLNADGTFGTEFDSNVDSQFGHVSPFQFTIDSTTPGQSVIAGWNEAFKLLPIGTVATLLIPPALGYGSQAQAKIPANSILAFDVTAVSSP